MAAREAESRLWDRLRDELEIIADGPPEDWAVRIYRIGNTYPDDGQPVLWCDNLYTAFEVPVSGTLHVNTRDTTELSSFHGRLEATTETGAEFVLESDRRPSPARAGPRSACDGRKGTRARRPRARASRAHSRSIARAMPLVVPAFGEAAGEDESDQRSV